jgi:hypothetical protein
LSRGGTVDVYDLTTGGVRISLLPTASSRAERSPDPREAAVFLELADQIFDCFRPDVLLTYCVHPAGLDLMRRARAGSIAALFHLHNFGYNDRSAFGNVKTIIFPCEYSRRHHLRLIGVDPGRPGVIFDPFPVDRAVAEVKRAWSELADHPPFSAVSDRYDSAVRSWDSAFLIGPMKCSS